MRPLFHMAAFVGEGVPNFEIRDAEKGTDLLVKTPYLGQALAKTPGQESGGAHARARLGHGRRDACRARSGAASISS